LVRESSEPLAEEKLGVTRPGGNPGPGGKEEILEPRRGSPEPPGDLVATGVLGVFLALVGG